MKYWESWSSIGSLYRHIYTSPTVAAVFRSETFARLTNNMTLEGPFKASSWPSVGLCTKRTPASRCRQEGVLKVLPLHSGTSL